MSSSLLKMTDIAVRRVVSDIIRSPEDKRVYRGLEFTNGLKAMLISDPTTDKSSAALDVHIGNCQSSSQHPGLALITNAVTFIHYFFFHTKGKKS